MAAAPTPPPHVNMPATFLIDGFVIETYTSMSQVPFASVSDHRGKAMKTSEHERHDELYGRCRTCMGQKSGEQLLLCDDCDRGFHMTCLVPVLRDVPKGEWHCPNCTRDRKYVFHRRATEVATMRKVLNDVDRRPTLPHKLRLKFLDIPGPLISYTRIPASSKSTSQQLQSMPAPLSPPVLRPARTLPPKCRQKQALPPPSPDDPPEVQEPTILFKKVAGDSVRKRRNHIARIIQVLTPAAEVRRDEETAKALQALRDVLDGAFDEPPEDEFMGTRTSDNSPSKSVKRTCSQAFQSDGAVAQSISEDSAPSLDVDTLNRPLRNAFNASRSPGSGQIHRVVSRDGAGTDGTSHME